MNLIQRIKNRVERERNKPGYDKNLNLFSFNREDLVFYSNTFEQFDLIYKSIFIDEVYSFRTTNTKPIIIDCGSNIGLAVRYWKTQFPESKIICFEPDPEVFKALVANTKQLSKVEVHRLALSDKVGEVEFTSNGKLSGSLNMSKNLPSSYKVKTELLSKYLQDVKVEMLKIDIEGEELKVLKEIEPYLVNVSNIFVEYHSFINEKQSLSKILKLLEESNFRYYLDSELKNKTPMIKTNVSLNQDLQVNIWAWRE